MITSQNIREKTFEKAVFGGYDMGSVDQFMESLAADLELLQKENQMLRGKMKVLVDKVEEYRDNEDALRMAVLSAQKLGNMIEAEAREKSETMLREAAEEAGRLSAQAKLEVEMEKARLEESKSTSAQFIDNMNLLCRRQLSFLEKVNEMDFMRERMSAAAEAPAETPVSAEEAPAAPETNEIHETIKSIEETMANMIAEPVLDVHPDIAPVAAEEEPTRAFSFATDPEDASGKTTQFSFEDLGK